MKLPITILQPILFISLVFGVLFAALPVQACSPDPSYQPPTIQEVMDEGAYVVRGEVLVGGDLAVGRSDEQSNDEDWGYLVFDTEGGNFGQCSGRGPITEGLYFVSLLPSDSRHIVGFGDFSTYQTTFYSTQEESIEAYALLVDEYRFLPSTERFYTPPAPLVTYAPAGYTLVPGMVNNDVADLQRALNAIFGFDLALDSVYGSQTIEAVRALQAAAGLFVDGVAGSLTQNAVATWRTSAIISN